jgi:hypothetical protein
MLGYWPYTTHKNIFLYFFIEKTQASQLIAIKDNKTQPGYWPKPVTGSTTVACICMLQWQGN